MSDTIIHPDLLAALDEWATVRQNKGSAQDYLDSNDGLGAAYEDWRDACTDAGEVIPDNAAVITDCDTQCFFADLPGEEMVFFALSEEDVECVMRTMEILGAKTYSLKDAGAALTGRMPIDWGKIMRDQRWVTPDYTQGPRA